MKRNPEVLTCLLVCIVLLTACAPVTTSPPPPAVQPDQPMVMAVGDREQIDGDTLTLSSVVEDSRCPSQVTCAWIGRGVLQFHLDTAGGQRRDFQLSTIHSPARTTQAVQAGHVFELQALEPYPETPDSKIPQRDYRATLTVAPLATAECPLRENDPDGYLTLICRYVHDNDLEVKPADPSSYQIKDIEERLQNARTVVTVSLNCCGMGDRAVIDKMTGEVLSLRTGAY